MCRRQVLPAIAATVGEDDVGLDVGENVIVGLAVGCGLATQHTVQPSVITERSLHHDMFIGLS